jgi:hypothetical protein
MMSSGARFRKFGVKDGEPQMSQRKASDFVPVVSFAVSRIDVFAGELWFYAFTVYQTAP